MMSDKSILNIGKSVFGFSFLLGSILFFSLYSEKMVEFAIFGGVILCLFALMNIIVFCGLIIYGFFCQSKLLTCIKSASILIINIPISLLYSCFINN